MCTGSLANLILVVEDSATQAIRLQMVLEREGARVVTANNGQTGLFMARQLRPNAVILDVELPQMNGFEVCRHLQGADDTRDIPIILFTRYDDKKALLTGLELGAIEFIPKDVFADAVLLATLRQMGILTNPAGMLA